MIARDLLGVAKVKIYIKIAYIYVLRSSKIPSSGLIGTL